jgi:hypothetical protein
VQKPQKKAEKRGLLGQPLEEKPSPKKQLQNCTARIVKLLG